MVRAGQSGLERVRAGQSGLERAEPSRAPKAKPESINTIKVSCPSITCEPNKVPRRIDTKNGLSVTGLFDKHSALEIENLIRYFNTLSNIPNACCIIRR